MIFTCLVYKDFFFTGHEEDKSFKYVSKIKDERLLLLSINVACTSYDSAIRDRVEILSSLSEYVNICFLSTGLLFNCEMLLIHHEVLSYAW